MIKILFICHGNICRSPMAEFVLKDILAALRFPYPEISVASAATSTEEIGNPVHHGTRNKLAQFGISTAGKYAVQMRRNDCQEYDYIIGMDSWNYRNMLRIAGKDMEKKISLLLDYTDHPRDVADPWYTGNFDITFDDILEGCEALLAHIVSEDRDRLYS